MFNTNPSRPNVYRTPSVGTWRQLYARARPLDTGYSTSRTMCTRSSISRFKLSGIRRTLDNWLHMYSDSSNGRFVHMVSILYQDNISLASSSNPFIRTLRQISYSGFTSASRHRRCSFTTFSSCVFNSSRCSISIFPYVFDPRTYPAVIFSPRNSPSVQMRTRFLVAKSRPAIGEVSANASPMIVFIPADASHPRTHTRGRSFGCTMARIVSASHGHLSAWYACSAVGNPRTGFRAHVDSQLFFPRNPTIAPGPKGCLASMCGMTHLRLRCDTSRHLFGRDDDDDTEEYQPKEPVPFSDGILGLRCEVLVGLLVLFRFEWEV